MAGKVIPLYDKSLAPVRRPGPKQVTFNVANKLFVVVSVDHQ